MPDSTLRAGIVAHCAEFETNLAGVLAKQPLDPDARTKVAFVVRVLARSLVVLTAAEALRAIRSQSLAASPSARKVEAIFVDVRKALDSFVKPEDALKK